MRVYFDSNIWIDYAWGIVNGTGKRKKYISNLIEVIQRKKIKVISSLFLNTEISAHFKDWFLLKKIIEDGFSYREFAKLKIKYGLNEPEKKSINSVIRDIIGIPWVEFVELEELNRESLNIFESLSLKFFIDSIDALHNIIAANENCRFLITKDEEMRTCMNSFLKNIGFKDDFCVCRPEEFLEKIENSKPKDFN